MNQRKIVGYVVQGDHFTAKVEAIQHVAEVLQEQCRIKNFSLTITTESADSGFIDGRRGKTEKFRRNLDRHDIAVAWLPDLGARFAHQRRAVNYLVRTAYLYLLLPNRHEPLITSPDPRGLDSLAPTDRERLESAISLVNREFQTSQQAETTLRLGTQRLQRSRYAPLGKRFLRRGGKVRVVDDPFFVRRARQLLKWQTEEGLAAPAIRHRLTRSGILNPTTGHVWSVRGIQRAIAWARQHRI